MIGAIIVFGIVGTAFAFSVYIMIAFWLRERARARKRREPKPTPVSPERKLLDELLAIIREVEANEAQRNNSAEPDGKK